MHIRDFDLNLLHTFQAVYAARSVSRAAEALSLSQPAVSHALAELETALSGLADEGDHRAAADIADELVRVAGDQVPYHQRRVEMAVRLQDAARLRLAYLDLADALAQGGDEGRARAVYARVLEMDPWDDRVVAMVDVYGGWLPGDTHLDA